MPTNNFNGLPLASNHLDRLTRSGLTPGIMKARGYRSEYVKTELIRLGFSRSQLLVPALVIPTWDLDGNRTIPILRPDQPRLREGKALKYEVPYGARLVIDVPPTVRPNVLDPRQRLLITEGVIKADAAASRELACLGLLGVWGWKNQESFWTGLPLAGRPTYIVFDSDVNSNEHVRKAAAGLKKLLEDRGAVVQAILLPEGQRGQKVGLDDFLAQGNSADDLFKLASA